MVDAVECFREIGSADDSAKRRLLLIKTIGDLSGEGNKGSYAGPFGGEAMLEGGLGERWEKEGAYKLFKDFRGGAEEGDRAIGRAEVRGFIGFKDGENEGMLPDRGELGLGKREVEEGGEEGQAVGTEMF